ncbi:amidohydrolase family protein [Pyxidicoccus sp. MSG2]|uniref:amidohydrolase family protein n=1 Tax=Pyxidicoccus sp. MSG2 TaxID=2996790 RepID=UPI002270A6F8|nr:amidohydrolase family protein [Pyxidicoccus sp. MSG2]MCY1021662.1 amidohydrolase family protein [Pyxidicoccus sp. MSG2]
MSTAQVPAGRIDVHHHLLPPFYVEALARHGQRRVAGAAVPAWTPERSLSLMDLHGIRTALVSISAPGVHFGDDAEAARLARACNEYAAELGADHPGRFGSFAVLPMPCAGLAAAEAVHALDTLGADGVVLLGSSRGVFLGHPDLDELMAELDRRSATVFVHPNLHATSETLGLELPGFLLEFLCDTTRAATNLIISGTLERYPRIRWILAHAGGFLPYIAWRLSLANFMPELSERAPAGILDSIRRFYFDTALSPSPYAMAALERLVDPTHILFGSDFPFAPEPVTAAQMHELGRMPGWDDTMRDGVARRHALALFPRLAAVGENVPAAPEAPRVTLGIRAKRAMLKPVVRVLSRLRER